MTPDRQPTRPSLLLQIRNTEDDQAWGVFIDIYAPLLYGYLRKRGVQDADAADLTQDILQKVSHRIGDFQYEASRGTFRGWLLTIALNRLRDFAKKQERQAKGTGKTAVHQLLMEVPQAEAENVWREQHERRLFAWAAEKAKADFREQTWQAFWRNAVEHQPAKEVAAELGISVGAVHIAKSRALSRIREIIAEVEG